jgi:hypothetical protein
MPRSSVDDREFEEEETAILYNFDEESALAKRQDYDKDTSYSLPVSGQASTSNPDNVEVNRRNMMYTFVPNWPLEGPKLDALSVLGHSKNVSSPFEAIAGLASSEYTILRVCNQSIDGTLSHEN